MDPDQYALSLGKIICNLQALELLLRAVLASRFPGEGAGLDESLPVGTVIAATPLTDYDQLRRLSRKFNDLMVEEGKPGIDYQRLVDVRDALAHGRVFTKVESNDFTLMKFGRPKDGSVTVTFNEVLSQEWFRATHMSLTTAIQRVKAEVDN